VNKAITEREEVARRPRPLGPAQLGAHGSMAASALLDSCRRKGIKALIRCFRNSKFLLFVGSHQIFEHMYEALNIDKKIINCTVWL
jgi:hypothetical protein